MQNFFRRSQYATEYLLVVSLSALLLVLVIITMVSHYSNVRYSVAAYQAYSVTNEIKNGAMEVYFLGEGSMTTMYITIPEGITESRLADNEILFRVSGSEGRTSDVYSVSPIEIDGNLPHNKGTYKITLTSQGDKVWLDI